jgi:hypothetical protein
VLFDVFYDFLKSFFVINVLLHRLITSAVSDIY